MSELNRLRIRTCLWFAWFAWTAPDANGDFIRLSGSNIYFTEAVVDQN